MGRNTLAGRFKHGTNAGYVRGCRCELCRTARNVMKKANSKARQERGICHDCKNPVANEGGWYCSDHIKSHAIYQKVLAYKKKLLGSMDKCPS